MTTFPALTPADRLWLPGATPATAHASANGRVVTVRGSNGRSGDRLQLRFQGLTTAQLHALAAHHTNHCCTWQRFSLPSAVWAPASDPTPAGSSWRYAKPPDIEDPPGGACIPDGFHGAAVELLLTPLPPS